MSDMTTIRVSEDAADELYEIKGRNRSYDDVVKDLIETYREAQNE